MKSMEGVINIILEGMTVRNAASLFGVRFSTLFFGMKRETTHSREAAFHQSTTLIKYSINKKNICSRMKYGLNYTEIRPFLSNDCCPQKKHELQAWNGLDVS
jgi:hypothetical protein